MIRLHESDMAAIGSALTRVVTLHELESCDTGSFFRAPAKYLTVAELVEHPEFKNVEWPLKPSQQGYVDVARGRGGPFKLYYEVHGTGPARMVLIMGLGASYVAWQRQTKDFGHDAGDRYSVLLIDNRGIGKSDKPWIWYSTTEMAEDVYDDRSLHVVGVSMGGMIAQELALAHPEVVCSLSLVSTAARRINTAGFWEGIRRWGGMFVPKSPDARLNSLAPMVLDEAWLRAPDDIDDDINGGAWPTNRDRWAAGELARRRLDPNGSSLVGFLLQGIAALRHHKSPSQLASLADDVGRARILVLHGEGDNMLTFPHGEVLAADLGPGVATAIYRGVGHCIPIERRRDFFRVVDNLVARTSALEA